ncbi:MAG TPA: bi-domain-containing oxidoreductase [Saprospiraceae bacterium]|nr:bi-domain-containing oxidoreductase [Saprospiraceae bacterium]
MMKLLLQSLKDGTTFIQESVSPLAGPNQILVKSSCSLVSPGTEKMLIQFGRSNPLDKIKQQPEKFKEVLQKIQNEGLFHTLDLVKNKLDQPIALGYSNVGRVQHIGSKVQGFKIGDRVVSNGPHAEFVAVSKHLCCKIPDNVSDEQASFAILASIALQGIRLLKVELGEKIVVMGLGLIGILACQILKASGCEVIAVDVSDEALSLAKSLGFKTYSSKLQTADELFQSEFFGIGADAVLITASSSQPLVNEAAQMTRKRGRIVLVGVVGNEINRDYFYKKELSFQVACSYGPGRYDSSYEDLGNDYPIAFVRWTEQRNIESVLQLMANGLIQTEPLVYKLCPFEKVITEFYNQLDELKWGNIIQYNPQSSENKTIIHFPHFKINKDKATIGIIGSGSFVSSVILPSLQKSKATIKSICSSQFQSAALAQKYSIHKQLNDVDQIYQDPEIDLILIANRHNAHATSVIKALQTDKFVFIEKPLCLTKKEFNDIQNAVSTNSKLYVGYNRNFAPLIQKIKQYIKGFEQQLNIVYTINAGVIDKGHWTQQIEIGGGRILGEVCHFVSLCQELCQSEVELISAIGNGTEVQANDQVSIQLKFKNGSTASIQYLSNGSKKAPKENIKLFYSQKIIDLNNFKTLKAYGLSIRNSWFNKMDKGHDSQFLLLSQLSDQLFNPSKLISDLHTSKVCFAIIDSIEKKQMIHLDQYEI